MLISPKVKQKQIEKIEKGNQNKVILYIMYKFKITYRQEKYYINCDYL